MARRRLPSRSPSPAAALPRRAFAAKGGRRPGGSLTRSCTPLERVGIFPSSCLSALTNQSSRSRRAKAGCGLVAPSLHHSTFHRARGGSCRATAQPAANRGEAGPACRSGWARLGAAEQRPPVSRTNHGVRAGNSAETADADRLDLLEMGRTLAANLSRCDRAPAASSRRRPRASCRAPPLSLVLWLISRHSECER